MLSKHFIQHFVFQYETIHIGRKKSQYITIIIINILNLSVIQKAQELQTVSEYFSWFYSC